jgi:hypothetical protein
MKMNHLNDKDVQNIDLSMFPKCEIPLGIDLFMRRLKKTSKARIFMNQHDIHVGFFQWKIMIGMTILDVERELRKIHDVVGEHCITQKDVDFSKFVNYSHPFFQREDMMYKLQMFTIIMLLTIEEFYDLLVNYYGDLYNGKPVETSCETSIRLNEIFNPSGSVPLALHGVPMKTIIELLGRTGVKSNEMSCKEATNETKKFLRKVTPQNYPWLILQECSLNIKQTNVVELINLLISERYENYQKFYDYLAQLPWLSLDGMKISFLQKINRRIDINIQLFNEINNDDEKNKYFEYVKDLEHIKMMIFLILTTRIEKISKFLPLCCATWSDSPSKFKIPNDMERLSLQEIYQYYPDNSDNSDNSHNNYEYYHDGDNEKLRHHYQEAMVFGVKCSIVLESKNIDKLAIEVMNGINPIRVNPLSFNPISFTERNRIESYLNLRNTLDPNYFNINGVNITNALGSIDIITPAMPLYGNLIDSEIISNSYDNKKIALEKMDVQMTALIAMKIVFPEIEKYVNEKLPNKKPAHIHIHMSCDRGLSAQNVGRETVFGAPEGMSIHSGSPSGHVVFRSYPFLIAMRLQWEIFQEGISGMMDYDLSNRHRQDQTSTGSDIDRISKLIPMILTDPWIPATDIITYEYFSDIFDYKDSTETMVFKGIVDRGTLDFKMNIESLDAVIIYMWSMFLGHLYSSVMQKVVYSILNGKYDEYINNIIKRLQVHRTNYDLSFNTTTFKKFKIETFKGIFNDHIKNNGLLEKYFLRKIEEREKFEINALKRTNLPSFLGRGTVSRSSGRGNKD